MKQKGLLIVVSGPSGAGKGTICKELLRRDQNIVVSVSATTRAPRAGEVNGQSYHFLGLDTFKSMIESDRFLEYAQVYDNYYGTPKQFVIDRIEAGENVLLEIDIQGALQVKRKYPEGIFVFVLPPSMKDLKNRILNRGSETQASLEKRLSCAYNEIEYIKNYDYFIINDTVCHATDILQSVIVAEKCRVSADIEDIVQKFKEEKEHA